MNRRNYSYREQMDLIRVNSVGGKKVSPTLQQRVENLLDVVADDLFSYRLDQDQLADLLYAKFEEGRYWAGRNIPVTPCGHLVPVYDEGEQQIAHKSMGTLRKEDGPYWVYVTSSEDQDGKPCLAVYLTTVEKKS